MNRVVPIVLIAMLWGLNTRTGIAEETIRSSSLGWTAGEDISEKFNLLLSEGRIQSGQVLLLEERFCIRGSYIIPAGAKLKAKKGAGFDVLDSKENRKPFLTLCDDASIENIFIDYLHTPELGGRSYKHGVDFFDKCGISVAGRKAVVIKNCKLRGMISHHVKFDRCEDSKLIGCHVIGGFWSVVLSGQKFLFKNCVFEQSCCDNIKGGADHAVFENCVFQDTCRDGIDTTGGLNDSIIRDCIFRRLGCTGLDLKAHYQKSLDRPENVNIKVQECKFYDMPNAVVLTTLDRGTGKDGEFLLNARNIKKYAPHNIELSDCEIGYVEIPLKPAKKGGFGVDYPRQGEHMRIILLKDAYGVRYSDIRLVGERIMPVLINSIGGSEKLSKDAADALDRQVTGNIVDKKTTPPVPGDKSIPFLYGPVSLD